MRLFLNERRKKLFTVATVALLTSFVVTTLLALFGGSLSSRFGGSTWEDGFDLSYGRETVLRKAMPVGDRIAAVGSVLRNDNLRYQIFFSLLDPHGNEIRRFELGGTGNDVGLDFVEDDGYVLLATSRSPDVATIGRMDVVLIKLNQNGELQWRRAYGSPGVDRAYKIEKTNTGYVFVGDVLTSGIDVPTHAGGFDKWVVHVDRSGRILWSRTFGGKGWDRAFGVTYVPNANLIVVVGPTNSGGNDSIYNSSVLFINADTGNLVSERRLTLNNGGSVWAQDVKFLNDGVYVGGYVTEPVTFGRADTGAQRFVEKAFLAKFTTNGTLLYFRTFGQDVRLYSLQPLEADEEVERLVFAGLRAVDGKRLPWYGNVTVLWSSHLGSKSNSPVVVTAERVNATEYGMLFNTLLHGDTLYFSGTRMVNGRIVGSIFATNYF